jgi:cytochrome c2
MARRLRPALEAAHRTHEVAAARWRTHRKECHNCHQAERDSRPSLACEVGFRLWQAVTRSGREERERRDGDAAQGGLQLALGD